jgi:hypothetical protein
VPSLTVEEKVLLSYFVVIVCFGYVSGCGGQGVDTYDSICRRSVFVGGEVNALILARRLLRCFALSGKHGKGTLL